MTRTRPRNLRKLPFIVGNLDEERERHEQQQAPEGISAKVNGQSFMSWKQEEEGPVEAVGDKSQCLGDRVDEQQEKCRLPQPVMDPIHLIEAAEIVLKEASP